MPSNREDEQGERQDSCRAPGTITEEGPESPLHQTEEAAARATARVEQAVGPHTDNASEDAVRQVTRPAAAGGAGVPASPAEPLSVGPRAAGGRTQQLGAAGATETEDEPEDGAREFAQEQAAGAVRIDGAIAEGSDSPSDDGEEEYEEAERHQAREELLRREVPSVQLRPQPSASQGSRATRRSWTPAMSTSILRETPYRWPEPAHTHRHQGVHDEPFDTMDEPYRSAFSKRVDYLNERAQAIAKREHDFERAVERECARRAEMGATRAGASVRGDAAHVSHDRRRYQQSHQVYGRQAQSCGDELQQRVQGLTVQRDQLLDGVNPLVRQDAESLAAEAAEMGLDYIRLLQLISATVQRYGPTIASAACRRTYGSMEFAGEEAYQLDLDSVWAQAVAAAQMQPRGGDSSLFRQRQRAQLRTPAPLSEPQQPATMSAVSAQSTCATTQGAADISGAHGCGASTAQSAALETLMRATGVDRATALAVLQQATGSTPGLSGADVRRAIAAAGETDGTEESATRQCKQRSDPTEARVVKVEALSPILVQITLPNHTIQVRQPGWFTGDLKQGLKLLSMRVPRTFIEVATRVPLTGYRLRQLVEKPPTAAAIMAYFPTTANDSNGYSVSRAPLMEEFLQYWIAVQVDSAPQDVADSAAADISKRLVGALCAHGLFRSRSSMLRTLLSEEPTRAITAAFHIADELYITPVVFAAASGAPRFDHRVWKFGESAADFFTALSDLGRLENKASEKVVQVFGARCVERQTDAQVLNFEVVNAVCDRFVNRPFDDVNLEGLKLRLRFDTMATTPLVAKASKRAPLGGAPQSFTVQQLQTMAAMHNLALVTAGGDGDGERNDADDDDNDLDHNDGSGQAFYGDGTALPPSPTRTRGKVVPGPANMQLWAKHGLCTQAEADASAWNHSRPDGLFGITCSGCGGIGANGQPRYSKELTFKECKEANGGVPPYAPQGQPSQPPPDDTVICHHRHTCYDHWRRTHKAVRHGKAPPEVLEPMSKAEFSTLLKNDRETKKPDN